jgi:hypothetical protein
VNDSLTCDLCKDHPGCYDFNNLCCRVRLLLNLPTKHHRNGWLNLWRRKDGESVSNKIKAEVEKQWGNKNVKS